MTLAAGKIVGVETIVLSHRLSRPRTYSTGTHDTRDSVLVRVRDGDGTTGWGETYLVPGVVVATRQLGNLLVGHDPLDSTLREAIRGQSRNGFVVGALSIALDDLRARRLGVSVATLHRSADARGDGDSVAPPGSQGDRARAYASSRGYVAGVALIDGWLEEVDELEALGIRAIKLRIGRDAPAVELPALTELRRRRPEVELLADANGAYTWDQALEMGQALHDLAFTWFEEPLPQSGYEAYEDLAQRLDIPVAGGELVQSCIEASGLIDRRAFDIVQPDVSVCGGLGEARAIANLTGSAGMSFVPHTCNGAIALAATLQLLAALPVDVGATAAHAPRLEYDAGENPLRTDLLTESFEIRDGSFLIPTAPGLGVDVDEAALDRYAA